MLPGRWMSIAATMSACMVGSPAHAQSALEDQLAACARIAKKNPRVACYDSIARPKLREPATTASGPSSTDATRGGAPPARAVQSATLGAEQIDRPRALQPKETGSTALDVVVTSARDNGIGMWTLNLADGAAWRMTERASDFRPPVGQERVTIRKGALGGYLMQVGKQVAVRVQRIR